MFYFRIDQVRFRDNGEIRSGFGIFGHDFAKVKFLSFVTRSDENIPDFDELVKSNDPDAKTTLLEDLIRRTLSTCTLTEIDRVQANVPVRFGDTGLILYQTEEIPESFTWTHLALDSKSDLRETAGDVDQALSKSDFSQVSSSLLTLIQAGSAVANPMYAAAIATAKFVGQVAARHLMQKGDKQLGAALESFIRPEHYPQIIRERHDVPDTTGNMFYDYSLFGKVALPVIRSSGTKNRRGGRATRPPSPDKGRIYPSV